MGKGRMLMMSDSPSEGMLIGGKASLAVWDDEDDDHSSPEPGRIVPHVSASSSPPPPLPPAPWPWPPSSPADDVMATVVVVVVVAELVPVVADA
jgi:hypothetical protein